MNSREDCLVKNEKLGTVLMMEVGALMVGKIRNYKKERCQVKRGEEKGMREIVQCAGWIPVVDFRGHSVPFCTKSQKTFASI